MKLIPEYAHRCSAHLQMFHLQMSACGKYRESIEDTLGKAYGKIVGNVHAYALLDERSATLACLRASHSRCSTRDLFKVEINLPNAQIKANRRSSPRESADSRRWLSPRRRCAPITGLRESGLLRLLARVQRARIRGRRGSGHSCETGVA